MSHPDRPRRWPWILAGSLLLIGALLFFGFRAGVRALEARVVAALGPGAQVESIRAGTTAVELTNITIPASSGWPAQDAFRAAQVRVVPAWRSLLGEHATIAKIEVDDPYLSILRTSDGGLRMLPSLLEVEEATPTAPSAGAATAPSRQVTIREIVLHGGTLELFDASVARKPWRLRLTALDATVQDVVAPALDGPVPLELRALLDGPSQDGQVALKGWVVPASSDLVLRADLDAIDLMALEPYLVQAAKARLARGTLDLRLDAKVEKKRLHAPGHLALSNLAFAKGGSSKARVLGVPRDVLIAAMQAKGGRIALDFSLDGDIDDPQFSLNETFATRVAVALAEDLGLSVSGLVEGTIGLGLDGLEGAGRAAGGVGWLLRKLAPR
jgi:hypothetical protein